MRFNDNLHALSLLADAKSIHTPIEYEVDADQEIAEFEGCLCPNLDEAVYASIPFLVTKQGDPIGFVSYRRWEDQFLSEFFSDDTVYQNTKFSDIAETIIETNKVTFNESFCGILKIAEKQDSDVLLVESDGSIQGSICLDDILKPPCLNYLSCLSSRLETAAIELCSFFPKCFDRLSEESKSDAKNMYLRKKKTRIAEYLRIKDDCGLIPDSDARRRELIQTTMMSDKKTMLLKSDFGLSASNSKIRRVFDFFERIRNYAAHPSAQFTCDRDEADFIEDANHEAIRAEGSSPYLVSQSIAVELSIERLPELAKAVRECHELIADIDAAIYRRRKCPPA